MTYQAPQQLPPKMAQRYADRAKAGDGRHLGVECYEFIEGREKITLVSLDPPMGHMTRVSNPT